MMPAEGLIFPSFHSIVLRHLQWCSIDDLMGLVQLEFQNLYDLRVIFTP